MQFAGQRTDLHLEPIGEPVNILIRLNEDILPEPDAVLLTGITPQQTLADGVTELEFLQVFTTSSQLKVPYLLASIVFASTMSLCVTSTTEISMTRMNGSGREGGVVGICWMLYA